MTDNIKEPAHYVANKIEPIDFIIENNFNWDLTICRCVIKYQVQLIVITTLTEHLKY